LLELLQQQVDKDKASTDVVPEMPTAGEPAKDSNDDPMAAILRANEQDKQK